MNNTALEQHHPKQPGKTMSDQNAEAEPTGNRKKRRMELWSWALVGSALGILGFGFVSLGEAYIPLGFVCGILGGIIAGYDGNIGRQ